MKVIVFILLMMSSTVTAAEFNYYCPHNIEPFVETLLARFETIRYVRQSGIHKACPQTSPRVAGCTKPIFGLRSFLQPKQILHYEMYILNSFTAEERAEVIEHELCHVYEMEFLNKRLRNSQSHLDWTSFLERLQAQWDATRAEMIEAMNK